MIDDFVNELVSGKAKVKRYRILGSMLDVELIMNGRYSGSFRVNYAYRELIVQGCHLKQAISDVVGTQYSLIVSTYEKHKQGYVDFMGQGA